MYVFLICGNSDCVFNDKQNNTKTAKLQLNQLTCGGQLDFSDIPQRFDPQNQKLVFLQCSRFQESGYSLSTLGTGQIPPKEQKPPLMSQDVDTRIEMATKYKTFCNKHTFLLFFLLDRARTILYLLVLGYLSFPPPFKSLVHGESLWTSS